MPEDPRTAPLEKAALRYDPRVAEVLVHVEPDESDQLAKLKGS
jgi:hypothetical protein